jgi:photosynthetic reaction center cytochrome c subunit
LPLQPACLSARAILFGADWDLPPVDTEQIGFRGTGMYLTKDREKQADLQLANVVPEPLYEADPEGDRAGDVYENVQVLGDLSDDQFNLFMASITEWVAPEQGCVYCHNEENLRFR